MTLFIPLSVLITIISLNAALHTAKPSQAKPSWTVDGDWRPHGRHTGAPPAKRLPFGQLYQKYVCLLSIEERKKESETGQSWFLNRLTKFQPFTFTSGPAKQQICQEEPTSQAPSSKLRETRKHLSFGISYGRGLILASRVSRLILSMFM